MCRNAFSKDRTVLKEKLILWIIVKAKRNICVFQVSRPYLGFCSDPKHLIVNCKQNVVKFAGKWWKMNWKMQFLYKIFWQNKMLCRPTIPSFFRAETWNTHIYFFWPNANNKNFALSLNILSRTIVGELLLSPFNQTLWKTITRQSVSFFWHWLPWKPDIKISWRLAKCAHWKMENWRFSGWLLRHKLFYINALLLLLKELLKHFLINWEQTTYSIRFVLLSNVSVTIEPDFINYQNWPFYNNRDFI